MGVSRSMGVAPSASMRALVGRDSGENLSAVRQCDLHCRVAHTASSGVDENGLSRVDFPPIDKAFPGGDADERERGSLTHCE